MNVVITTGSTHDSISRHFPSIDCDSEFSTSIVPGLGYDFEITPKIKISRSGATLSVKTKSLTVFNEMDPLIISFQIAFQWTREEWNSLGYIDQKSMADQLAKEVSALTALNRDFITVSLDESKGDSVKVRIMTAKIDGSTKPQVAIEKIRNMFYQQPDAHDAQDMPLLLKLTSLRSKMAISSLRGYNGPLSASQRGSVVNNINLERHEYLGIYWTFNVTLNDCANRQCLL